MGKSFLEHVLEDLHEKSISVEQCTFVLPSKRSGTFLKKHIGNTLSKNIFSPPVLSIEEFIRDISGLTPSTNIDLLFALYEAYKTSPLETKDNFDTFLKWGQTILQDFNEIDRYLIPSKDILNYLSAIKELNHWSLKKDKTELVKNYLALWNNLEYLYNSFTSHLLAHNSGYQGLMYRTAIEKLQSYTANRGSEKIVFIGFNALNTAESTIIQHFLSQGNCYMYWDIDSYFLNDPIHDAGLFIRNYKRDWHYYQTKALSGTHSSFLSPKSISVIGVPKSISQAKYVGKLLEEMANETSKRLESTALVLADETLLNPVLKAIPSNVKEANITMGLPLNKTVLYTFFLSLLELYVGKTKKGWFYKDVLKIVSNPYCSTTFSSEAKDFVGMFSQDIKKNNLIYLNTQFLSRYPQQKKILSLLFPSTSITPQLWVDNCLSLIQNLKTIFEAQENTWELEHLYRFYALFNQLKQHLVSTDVLTHLKSVKSFFKQLASSETFDFIGEPLFGLQIMGMLESRNLDFETVIITSVNEGILPAGKSNSSFIPFDVKREYGLPTYKEKDAIYTYHFYRLIQRAKKVYLIYNTEPDGLEGGERSRLISQLLTDENIYKYVTHTIASPKVNMSAIPPIQIAKTHALLEDIKAFALNGFSPTSLTNYIRNPIDFYKRSILKIYEVEEVEDNIAANTFGTIVHDSLEALYQPLVGKLLTEENLSSLLPEIQKEVEQQFQKSLPGIDTTKGRFLLVYNVIVKYLQKFVQLEMEVSRKHQIKLVAVEEKYEVMLNIPELDFPVKLKGTLDRVDELDGVLRIVDYKTGKVEPRNVKITDWEGLISNYDKSKAFQLLCYAYLYAQEKPITELQAGIFSIKNLGKGFMPFTSSETLISQDTLETFKVYLQKLVLEICSKTIPLTEKEV